MFNYIEPVFRPPSEGKSFILQVSNGCSWNNCTFCDMYTQPQKKFRPREEEYIIEELQKASTLGPRFEKVFLADGDAMTLSIRRLTRILELIKEYLPWVNASMHTACHVTLVRSLLTILSNYVSLA